MSLSPVPFAVVGCGRVAANHIDGLRSLPEARLVAVCDQDLPRAAAWGTRYGIPAYASYFAMLDAHPEIAVVNVATPSGMHYEHACDLLEAGRCHLIVEKPLVMTVAQGEALLAAATRAGRCVYPVFQNRYNRAVRRAHQAVTNGELGALRLATVRLRWQRTDAYYAGDPWRGLFALDGGALTNQGIHFLDLLRHLAGEITWVQASLRTHNAKIEVEDTCVAIGELANGASLAIEITTAVRPDDIEGSLSLIGSTGYAILGGTACNQLTHFSPAPAECANFCDDSGSVYGVGHPTLFRAVIAHLQGGPAPLSDAVDALGTIQLLHALYRSDETAQRERPADRPVSVRLGRTTNADVFQHYRTARP